MRGRREGFSGITIKDTWTKPRWGWHQGREVGMARVGGKCRQVYLNNNTNIKIIFLKMDKLTVTRAVGEGDNGRKKEKDQVQEHV